MKSPDARYAAVWNPITLIEAFAGERLSPAIVAKMENWPLNEKEELIGRLSTYLHDAIAAAHAGSVSSPSESDERWFGQLDAGAFQAGSFVALPTDTLKQQLLYIPNIAVRDPLADTMARFNAPEQFALSYDAFSENGETRHRELLFCWLDSLCQVAPAIEAGYLQLVIPSRGSVAAAILDSYNIKEFDRALKPQIYDMLTALADDLEHSPDPVGSHEIVGGLEWHKIDVKDPVELYRSLARHVADADDETIARELSHKLGFARSVACRSQQENLDLPWQAALVLSAIGVQQNFTPLIIEALASNLQLGLCSLTASHSAQHFLNSLNIESVTSDAARQVRITASTLSHYRLPGISGISFDDLMNIRANEEAFDQFRRTVASIVGDVDAAEPADQQQFEIELQHTVDDKLKPEIDQLKKTKKSSVLEKVLIPGAISLGGGALVMWLTHGTYPVGAAVSAGLTPAALVADAMTKRLRKSGRKQNALANAYLTFQRAAKENQK